jgi:hypothetical protein
LPRTIVEPAYLSLLQRTAKTGADNAANFSPRLDAPLRTGFCLNWYPLLHGKAAVCLGRQRLLAELERV